VKIALGRLHFHGFGVARQGPWITWVNKGVAVALGTHDGHYGRGAWFRPQVLFGEEELWRPGATPPTPI
jgi:hypothetical protein